VARVQLVGARGDLDRFGGRRGSGGISSRVAACSVVAGAAASAAGAAVSAGLEQAAMARVRASGSSSLRVALI
jgi:hypothetical protein